MATTTTPDALTVQTLDVVKRSEEAINRHDLDALAALLAEDCVFENTFPAPDGTRHEGHQAVLAAFAEFFRASPCATFEEEERFACGERAVVRWRYRWFDAEGREGHVRGADILRVRDGKLAESLAYVKG
jgi:ketosteroid isomerase-like protein